ncbi:MAG: DUF2807 domain-containing protein [Flavobacteriales bacterium]|nr:DUF2807 domain-containing protein [Flavobacteriales bacterium]
MKTLLLLALVGVTAVAATTWRRTVHVTGSGEVIRRTLPVADFHGFVLAGSMNVHLVRAEERKVEVEAQANIADLVTTTVKDGIWLIDTKENYRTNKPFIIHIHAPVIDRVHVDGSGDVKGTGSFIGERMKLGIAGSGSIHLAFEAREADADISGSGSIHISGSCGAIDADIAGSGDINAAKLQCTDAEIDVAGSGSATIDATGSVQASIAGSGNVVLMRKPAALKKSIDGSGSVSVRE